MELLNDLNSEAMAAFSRPSHVRKSGLSEISTSDEVIEYMKQLRQKLLLRTRKVSRLTTNRVSFELSEEQIKIIVSMLPDEVIQNSWSSEIRRFEGAMVSLDISGFTDLSEKYQQIENGASKLSMMLNSYLGTMVVSILTTNL